MDALIVDILPHMLHHSYSLSLFPCNIFAHVCTIYFMVIVIIIYWTTWEQVTGMVPHQPQIFHHLFPLLSHKHKVIIQGGNQHSDSTIQLTAPGYITPTIPTTYLFLSTLLQSSIMYRFQSGCFLHLFWVVPWPSSPFHDLWILQVIGLSVCKMSFSLGFFLLSSWPLSGHTVLAGIG